MQSVLSGLVPRPSDAQQIIEELTAGCGCERSDISLLAGGTAGQLASTLSRGLQAGGHVANTAGGAVADSLEKMLGTATRLVSEPTSLFGGLTAAGELATTLTKNALKTAADLSRTLVEFGVQEQLANQYAEALREGSILLIVRPKTDKAAACARSVLASHGATASDGWPGGTRPAGAGAWPSR